MRIWPCCVLASLLFGCGTSDTSETTNADTLVVHQAPSASGSAPLVFKEINDNLKHDTLLIQVTFDMGDGTFIMVASNVEETFEGVRLYRYQLKGDGGVDMISASSPGYDSWTMLPTFFLADGTNKGMWLLANMGERESWGQKLIWMAREFTDMGFMDIALPERVMEDDTLRLKRRNIAPSTRFEERNDTSYFRFACDSVFLYDDQAGNMDQVLAARDIHFTYHRGEGLALWVNGEKRLVKKPA